MIGRIKIGNKTANHAQTLSKLGYTVAQNGDHINVEVSGFIKEVDLSNEETAKDKLKEVIANKQAFTYQTRALVSKEGEEKVMFSFPFCNYLDRLAPGLSCLVMKASSGKKASKAAFSLDDLLGGGEPEAVAVADESEDEAA